MQKSLPTLFIIAISAMAALFFHQWMQQKRMNQQYKVDKQSLIHTIQDQNLEHETSNIQLKENMEREVEEEILNQNKKDNQFLPDTLAIIRDRTQLLLTDPSLSRQDVVNWKEELTELLLSGNAFLEEYLMKEEPFTLAEDWHEDVQLHHVLLSWEESAYQYLNWRLGVARCWLTKTTQQIISTRHIAIAGETFIANLQIAIESSPVLHVSNGDSYFSSSIGHTVYSPATQTFQLIIDTNDVLAPGENQKTIDFEITARYRKATGGYWSYPMQHSLTVVRVADH